MLGGHLVYSIHTPILIVTLSVLKKVYYYIVESVSIFLRINSKSQSLRNIFLFCELCYVSRHKIFS